MGSYMYVWMIDLPGRIDPAHPLALVYLYNYYYYYIVLSS